MATPERQVWFTKAVTSINAPYDPIEIAKGTFTADYEVELVAVVGQGGKHVSAADAPAAIFGYCVGNDVTERMWQHAGPQWSLGKSFDTHAPIGPGSSPPMSLAIHTSSACAASSMARSGRIRIPGTWSSTSGSRLSISRLA